MASLKADAQMTEKTLLGRQKSATIGHSSSLVGAVPNDYFDCIAEVSFREPRGGSQQPSRTKYTHLTGLIREFFGTLP